MLKRHRRVRFDLSPQGYRARWNLSPDYPIVAPNYVARRRAVAQSIGLGRKVPAVATTPVVEPVKRGRKKRGIAVDETLARNPAVAEKKPAAKPKPVRKSRAAKAG